MDPIFTLEAVADSVVKLIIDGDITGLSLDTLTEAIEDIEADEIRVIIRSYGGDLLAGAKIYRTLADLDALITVEVMDYAMSAASVIAMAGDHVVMPEDSVLMIHGASAGTYGTAGHFREMADSMDEANKLMAQPYSEKSGHTIDFFIALITDGEDHYFSANECLALGLCDEVSPANNPEVYAQRLQAGRYIGVSENDLRASAQKDTPREGLKLEEYLKQLRALLGLDEDATQEQVTAHVTGLQASVSALKASATAQESLTARVAELEAENAKLVAGAQADRIEALVSAAQDEGRATPAMKESLVAFAEANFTAFEAHLAALPVLTASTDIPGNAASGSQGSGLTAAEKEVAKSMGISEEAMLAAKGGN